MKPALAALALIVGCGEPKRPPAPSGSASGSGSGSDASRAATDPGEAALRELPGTLWFIEDGPPRSLVRLVAGARRSWTQAGADLYPMAARLPDGRLVAIASRGDGGPGAEQVALVTDDGEVERVGPAAPQVRDPAVDPRGRWIIVAANLDGHSDLYRLDLNAGRDAAAVRLTRDPQGNFAPTRLAAGAIAFVSSRDGDAEIYRMAVDGGKPRRLTAFHRDDWQPTTSPDGATIAFTSDREGPPRIFLMAPDGTGQRRLTSRAGAELEESDPVWSPDGRSLAYLVRRAGETRVWVRDVATGEDRALTPAGARDAEPSWAPDGAWIAVSRSRGHDSELWVMPVAGGTAVRVPATTSARLPRWL